MSTSDPYLLMLGCFDTKGEVFSYLRDCLLVQGERVVTVNTGIRGSTDEFPVDIESNLVALEGGHDLMDLREKGDRRYAVDIMGIGAANIVEFLVAKGGVKGIISFGGGGGTYIALSAMRKIPIVIPKICLSTLTAQDLTHQMGSKDVILMPFLVDLAALNSISKILIRRVAAAICAMGNIPADDAGEW